MRKIADPSLDVDAESAGLVRTIVELLESEEIETETGGGGSVVSCRERAANAADELSAEDAESRDATADR